ncbi:MAG TPA: copper resistance protein CopC [Acidimicrobiales bacterium]|nr:copper resistance protein CopC [Acidimicrobiales bacterium]
MTARRQARPRATRALRAAAGLAVAAVLLVALPGRADAHATLESSQPSAGQQLKTPPEQVVLNFSEAVDIGKDSIRVLNSKGDSVTKNKPTHPNGERSVAALALPELDDGAYVVSWKAISSDSHPVSGAFTFRVGAATGGENDQALLKDVLNGSAGGGDHVLGAIFGMTRFLAFAGLILVVGGMVFVTWVWPAGRDSERTRGVLVVGLVLAAVTTLLCIPLQAAYGIGGSLGDVVDPSNIADELGSRTGRSWLVRLVLLGVVWLLMRARRLDRWAAAGLGLALLVTVSLTGHASSGDNVPLAFVVDLFHLSGASVWLGGLALLLLAVLWRGSGVDDTEAEATVGLFSQVAFAAVGVIVVSGVIQALRQLGGWNNLFDTTYGRLLVVKVLVVAVMLVAAAFSRSWVRDRAAARTSSLALSPGPGAVAASPDRGATALSVLRWSVGAEVALGICVLAVTALLVNAVPGAEAGAGPAGGPFTTQVHGQTFMVTVDVAPTVVGQDDISLKVTDHGLNPIQPEEVTASLSLPGKDLGAIPLKLTAGGTGEYRADGTDIPLAGNWDLHVVVRTTDIDEETVKTSVPIS